MESQQIARRKALETLDEVVDALDPDPPDSGGKIGTQPRHGAPDLRQIRHPDGDLRRRVTAERLCELDQVLLERGPGCGQLPEQADHANGGRDAVLVSDLAGIDQVAE